MAITAGNLATEAEAEQAFDLIINNIDLFRVYKEVPGTLAQARPGQLVKGMRIDRILVPNERLIGCGWNHGIVGVELKRSGVKIGPALSQAIDYSRSVFTLPNGGFNVWLSYVFVYPAERQHGPMASMLAQNRIGTADSTPFELLRLATGEQNVLRVTNKGDIKVGPAAAGNRAGSR